MSDLRKKLETEIEECSWGLLEKNIERGAVFLTSPELELVDVAVAIAQDQSQTVANWLANNQLKKLELDDCDEHKNSQFKFLIVQPYVIAKIN